MGRAYDDDDDFASGAKATEPSLTACDSGTLLADAIIEDVESDTTLGVSLASFGNTDRGSTSVSNVPLVAMLSAAPSLSTVVALSICALFTLIEIGVVSKCTLEGLCADMLLSETGGDNRALTLCDTGKCLDRDDNGDSASDFTLGKRVNAGFDDTETGSPNDVTNRLRD